MSSVYGHKLAFREMPASNPGQHIRNPDAGAYFVSSCSHIWNSRSTGTVQDCFFRVL